jgi:hypothetical protein
MCEVKSFGFVHYPPKSMSHEIAFFSHNKSVLALASTKNTGSRTDPLLLDD